MMLAGINPLVKISAALFGVGVLALLLVLAPSIVVADVPETDTAIDPSLMRVGRTKTPPLANYEVIVARPLFNVGRRTDPAPPAPAPPKPPPLPVVESYRLVGLVLSPGLRLALVARPQGGDLLRLRPGDMLDGWNVEAVDTNGVVLSGQGNTAHMKVTRAPSVQGDVAAKLPEQQSVPPQSTAHP
jgi:hypothetical protein